MKRREGKNIPRSGVQHVVVWGRGNAGARSYVTSGGGGKSRCTYSTYVHPNSSGTTDALHASTARSTCGCDVRGWRALGGPVQRGDKGSTFATFKPPESHDAQDRRVSVFNHLACAFKFRPMVRDTAVHTSHTEPARLNIRRRIMVSPPTSTVACVPIHTWSSASPHTP